MKIRTIRMIIIVASLAGTLLQAQEDMMSQGRKFYAEEKWGDAIKAFAEATTDPATKGPAIFWLGLSKYKNGQYESAMATLLRADKLQVYPVYTKVALARCFAVMKEDNEAFFWLEEAVKAGYSNIDQLDNEEAFASMRSKLQMEIIRRTMQKNNTPAEFDARFRVMDFWIGEWDVFDQNGIQVGTNTITKELGGAILMERWTNAGGVPGASINFFDPGTGKFKQQWVDQTGYNTAYEGDMVDGSMVMIGVNADIKGVVSRNRMIFTPNPDGTVTQFIETYTDSTQTWSPAFTGTYRKKVKD